MLWKGKTSEHSAELGASCPIMKKMPWPLRSVGCPESDRTSAVIQRNIWVVTKRKTLEHSAELGMRCPIMQNIASITRSWTSGVRPDIRGMLEKYSSRNTHPFAQQDRADEDAQEVIAHLEEMRRLRGQQVPLFDLGYSFPTTTVCDLRMNSSICIWTLLYSVVRGARYHLTNKHPLFPTLITNQRTFATFPSGGPWTTWWLDGVCCLELPQTM